MASDSFPSFRHTLLGVGPPLLRAWLLLLERTWRVQVPTITRDRAGGDRWSDQAALEADHPRPWIGAFWHDQMVGLARRFRGPEFAVVVSHHTDGELVARVLHAWGTRSVRGATARGGERVVREAQRLLADGISVGVTPDGPLGPRHRAHGGVVVLAAASGRPIVPVAFAAWPALHTSGWDRMVLPLPGARVTWVIGEPIRVASYDLRGGRGAAEQVEAGRREVERVLAEATHTAEQRVRPLRSHRANAANTTDEH